MDCLNMEAVDVVKDMIGDNKYLLDLNVPSVNIMEMYNALLNGGNVNNCYRAVGPLYACQCSLKAFVYSRGISMSQRYTAIVIYTWLLELEASIDELVSISSPYVCEFILKCLDMTTDSDYILMDSNLILNYAEAIGSLRYQLNRLKVMNANKNNTITYQTLLQQMKKWLTDNGVTQINRMMYDNNNKEEATAILISRYDAEADDIDLFYVTNKASLRAQYPNMWILLCKIDGNVVVLDSNENFKDVIDDDCYFTVMKYTGTTMFHRLSLLFCVR